MANANGILATLDRKAAISTAAPERFTALRQAADNLSRHNVDAATCEVLNEALARLVQLAYEVDAGGLCNVDASTGRVYIPLPWGRNGAARWGIRPQEANILRQILFDWQIGSPAEGAPALLHYERSRRAWFVNIAEFGSIGIAKAWLRSHQITVGLYRSARAKRLV